MSQEVRPTGLVFFGSFTNTENLAVAMLIYANGYQYGNVAYFATPGALQDDAVQIDIGMFASDRPIAPFIDLGVDLLVEVADGAGTNLGPPQSFGNVLDPADRYPARYISISASSTEASRRR